MRFASLLLKIGVLVPMIYFGVVVAGGLLWPGYDHMVREIHDLGTAAAPQRQLFNYGLIAAGACAVLGALGVLLGVQKVAGSLLWAVLAAACIAAFGLSLVAAGHYPVSHPRHEAWQIGLAILAAPLLLFLGIAGRSDMGGLKTVLILSFLAGVGLHLVLNGYIELDLVQQATAGLWQRVYALATIPWIGLACLGLDQALARRVKRRRDPMREIVFAEPSA